MTIKKIIRWAGLACLVAIVAGCSAVVSEETAPADRVSDPDTTQAVAAPTPAEVAAPTGESNPAPTGEAAVVAELESANEENAVTEPASSIGVLPRPENQLKDGEYAWSQLLPRDGIRPIYKPEFAPAAEAPYDDNELVIGVEIGGEAKAYAIGPLNGREMVNDELGGIPILVTW